MSTRPHVEYKRDFPFGVSTSMMLHVVGILFLFSLLSFYVVKINPASQEVKSQIITIETLVRNPEPTKVVPERIVAHPVTNQVVDHPSTETSTQDSTGHGHRSVAHVAQAGMVQAASVRPELTTISRLPTIKSVKAPKYFTRDSATAGNNASTAIAQSGGPVNSKTGNDPSSGPYDIPGPGGNGHAGPIWSEGVPGTFGGRGGHGHDDCTPSRGGLFC